MSVRASSIGNAFSASSVIEFRSVRAEEVKALAMSRRRSGRPSSSSSMPANEAARYR